MAIPANMMMQEVFDTTGSEHYSELTPQPALADVAAAVTAAVN